MSQQQLAGAAPACQRADKVLIEPKNRAERRRLDRITNRRTGELEQAERERDQTALPLCPNLKPFKMKCTHGGYVVNMVPCGRHGCQACHDHWRYDKYWEIRYGVALIRSKLPIIPNLPGDHPTQPHFNFLTITLADTPGVYETWEQLTDRLMASWKRLERNFLWRRHKGHYTYRVLEFGDKNGRPHLHIITTADIPEAEPVSQTTESGERVTMTKEQWEARLSDDAREFQERLHSAGFGGGETRPIFHAERVRTANSVASYISKYMSKESKTIRRADGKKQRLTGHTTNWPTPNRMPMYRYGTGKAAPEHTEPVHCDRCRQEMATVAFLRGQVMEHRARLCRDGPCHPDTEALITTMSRAGNRALRRMNAEYWLLGLDTGPARENFINTVKRWRRYGRLLAEARQPPQWRRAMRNTLNETLVRQRRNWLKLNVRALGYAGPLRLLDDWARADFDLAKMLRAAA